MSAATAQRLIFAGRTTIAALLACFVAFYVHLPQASTSMITVFIVSQPLAGMVLSKSIYRVAGTAVGATVAVALTALFSDAPELFAVAVSLWIGACVAASIYLRDAPASYGAMLSGYSVAIIAFPAVDAPDAVFLAALDRASEIFVGIVCATALSQTVFPQSAAATLRRATGAALASASSWAADTLRGRPDPAKTLRDRRDLVGRVSKLEGLRVQATFDSAAVRRSNRRIRLLHGRLISFLALLVSIHDRLEGLRAERPDRAEALGPLLTSAAAAMAPDASEERRAEAEARLRSALPDLAAMRADRSKVFERTILQRVADLVGFRGDLDRLARLDGEAGLDEAASAIFSRYRDHALALVSGVAAFVALLATCGFWIASGWNGGAGAAIMVAVMMSLFAPQDDPARATGVFFNMTAVGAVVAAVYAFAILPGLEGFEMLALALAPALFAAAYAMTFPRAALPALACALGALHLIGLADVMTPDFAGFANAALAQLFGIGVAAALLRTLRPIGAAWPIARLTRGVRTDLADAVSGRRAAGRLAFESQMFDRIDGLMTRLDLSDPDQLAVEQGALAGLRVGLSAMALRGVVRDLPEPVSGLLADALADVARHFRRLARGEEQAPPLARLDAALEAALQSERDDAPDVAVWITAVRASLAQHPRMFGGSADEPVEAEPLRAAA
jgi:uncharacterized membrane protein YccC